MRYRNITPLTQLALMTFSTIFAADNWKEKLRKELPIRGRSVLGN